MKTVVALAVVLVAVVGVTMPAGAKGVESVTVAGPGFDEPVEAPSYVMVAFMSLASPFDTTDSAPMLKDPPPVELGEKYTLTWKWAQPESADDAEYTVVQDIYPDAHTAEVPVYVHPSTFIGNEGGWTYTSTPIVDAIESLKPVAPAKPADPASPVLPTAAGLAVGLAAGLMIPRLRRSPRSFIAAARS